MEKENNRIQLPLEEIKLAFAASCVEGAARKLGVPYIEIYERMRKVDLINKFILPHYDTLHTESREYLIEDVIECLTNWEKKDHGTKKILTDQYQDTRDSRNDSQLSDRWRSIRVITAPGNISSPGS